VKEKPDSVRRLGNALKYNKYEWPQVYALNVRLYDLSRIVSLKPPGFDKMSWKQRQDAM